MRGLDEILNKNYFCKKSLEKLFLKCAQIIYLKVGKILLLVGLGKNLFEKRDGSKCGSAN